MTTIPIPSVNGNDAMTPIPAVSIYVLRYLYCIHSSSNKFIYFYSTDTYNGVTTRNNGLNQTGAELDRLVQSWTDWYRVGQPGQAAKHCQMLSAWLIRRVGLLMQILSDFDG